MTPVEIVENVSSERFAQIRQAARPAVLRGVARGWPLVAAAFEGSGAVLEMLAAMGEGGAAVGFVRAEPEVEGRLHYSDDLAGANFARHSGTLRAFLDAVRAEAGSDRPASLAAQGIPARPVFPGFAERHRLAILPAEVEPRLWIGNRAKVAVHHDPAENLAVVAAGQRRFTLFAPEQVGNLYMGPFDPTPAGTQIGMAQVTAPDFERYPRFADALDAALVTELGPGDAIYIPFQWYHHVEALSDVSVLVNYWWNQARTDTGSPWDAMMHAMMSLRTLPADQRAAWRAMFDHYVFETGGNPGAHLPLDRRGILGAAGPGEVARMRRAVLTALSGRGLNKD